MTETYPPPRPFEDILDLVTSSISFFFEIKEEHMKMISF